ncbi:MAG: 2-isopropylmalate synthase [Candidatus Peregrinibacteria bacterium]|nr:2-isopropylmalate synthase [Candidatus Peregrinibacteria bacterium]
MSPNNNYVRIFDTTLRDGEQSPGNSMNLQEKLRMARQLERLGVDVIEAGFPITSPQDFEAVKEIAKVIQTAEVCGLARAVEKDILCAWDALKHAKKPRIHTFVATSDIHMKHKLKKSRDEVMAMAIKAVKLSKSLCDCSQVEFSPEDAFRSDPEFLYKVLTEVIEAGADVVNIPDTVGYSTPKEYGDLIAGIMKNVPNIGEAVVSTHCHNDLGMSVANSLEGVRNGARQIECTINGIGERAGNASLEEVVMALTTRKDFFGLDVGINTKEIYHSSRLLTSITGVPVQPNKAVVGANAFAHASGIHQDGVLKERTTYEIMKPEDIGLDSNRIILGKHSGRHALKDRLESLGYDLNDEEIDEIFARFKTLADKKKVVYDEDLVLLVNQAAHQEAMFYFKDIKVTSGTVDTPWAEVTLVANDGGAVTSESNGDGPVDAAYSAINNLMQVDNTLLEYSVNAVTEGIDAQATVAVQIEVGDRKFSDSGSDTDIIVASVKAYIGAMNKALVIKHMGPEANRRPVSVTTN